MPVRSLETQNPTCPGGTLLGRVAARAALAGLAALELRRRRSTVHAAPMKNEEKREEDMVKER
jgi:hypothetical protein